METHCVPMQFTFSHPILQREHFFHVVDPYEIVNKNSRIRHCPRECLFCVQEIHYQKPIRTCQSEVHVHFLGS